MRKINKRPGFVRVLIASRGKTIQIREAHARDNNYMTKHGLTIIQEPIAPPVTIAPVQPPIANETPKTNQNHK